MPDPRARRLRKSMTDAERKLWHFLRMRQLEGHKFRRQVRIGPYIADFACLKALLVVEVDGGQHAEARAYDSRRDDFMRGQGFRVLRFWNNEVLSNIDGVWQMIVSEINGHTSCRVTPHPNLPPQGGKGLQRAQLPGAPVLYGPPIMIHMESTPAGMGAGVYRRAGAGGSL